MTIDWLDKGTITPELYQWVNFPIASNNGLTFKVVYTADFGQPINSFVWFRDVYGNGEVGRAIRLYPKSEIVVFDMIIPLALQEQYQGVRRFQVRKQLTSNKFILPDQRWAIRLEEALLHNPP